MDPTESPTGPEWLLDVLWPGQTVDVGVRRPREHDHVALPGTGRTRLLVPPRPAALAATAMGHTSVDRTRARRRVRDVATTVAARLLPLLPLPALGAPRPMAVLEQARQLDDAVVGVGVRLGTPRPNRKPVVLAGGADGRLRAVGKVGFDEHTRGLVDRLHRRLERADGGDDVLVLPRVLHRTDDGTRLVHWQSPLPIHRATPDIGPTLLVGAMRRIVALAGRTTSPVARSSHADGLRRRASATGEAAVTRAVDVALARHGDVVLAHGAWHGDLTRWNMAADGPRLLVWDWERTDDDVPVGLDACHLHLDLRAVAASPDRALAAATRASAPLLSELGVPATAVGAVRDLHLAELAVRFAGHRPLSTLVDSLCRLLEGRP